MANPELDAERVPGGPKTLAATAAALDADDHRGLQFVFIQNFTGNDTMYWGYIKVDGTFVPHGFIKADASVSIKMSPLTPATIYVRGTAGQTCYWSSALA